ncbi:MAG: phosphoenolpyruvate synthase [Desulfovibrio sp.]|jgi:pyruvate,water dikinase|nr:phosphoenolpyruvate synthase [Desulfovibrio sp.]
MTWWRKWLRRLFAGNKRIVADKGVVKKFRKRYAKFRKLLDANAALADIMTELEVKIDGKSMFGVLYVRRMVEQAVEFTRRMTLSLEEMNPGKHRGLNKAFTEIGEKVRVIMDDSAALKDLCPHLTLPLCDIHAGMVDWVGGKCANLGEMAGRAGIPVPRGFAVTTTAFHRFMAHENLGKDIEDMLARLRHDDLENLSAILNAIRARVEGASLPDDLSEALEESLRRTFGEEKVYLAVRSSAQVEDGRKSFAGQFLTDLGVSRDKFTHSYRRVVASLFTPSATLYRMHQGIPISASAMGVGCLEIIEAVSSGVAYSHDPVDLMSDTMVINGVWGLGSYAVDGVVEPDLWVFSRQEKPELLRGRPGDKERKLVISSSGTPVDSRVPDEERRRFALSETEVQELAGLILRLEQHYGVYQDVEWAKTEGNTFFILQSRPLGACSDSSHVPMPPLLEQYPLLLEGGDIAYAGVGFGPVVMPRTSADLLNFPDGGILAAVHSNAEYSVIMDKAQAVLTQTGGITGHMATICREYNVPTILNVPGLMQILQPGMEVTVDAFSGRIYAGKAEELLPLRASRDSVRLLDTPVHALLRDVAEHILPLNLTDPFSSSFSPVGCQTLHDIMRYVHEASYQEMFVISDSATDAGGVALKLKAPLPIDLYLIDLDNGTTVAPSARSVTPEEILSVPFKALLGGMLRPEVMFHKPRPVNLGGFLSVVREQIVNPQAGERFGDKSYAVISDRYMNFSSRVGYHYSVLDSYCGNTVSKNYISFSFQGGAAGEIRRIRRIRAIALVLEELGFTLVTQGDFVKARFQKYPKKSVVDRLDQLGRLLQVTRQMDMLMVNDAAVLHFKENFMKGVYH